MDRRERSPDEYGVLKAALEGWQAKLWTALPAIIVSYDASKQTCQCQPTIQALVRDQQGIATWVTLPVLVDVPVLFPGAGGFTLTFPVTAGDEVLVVFSSRCIDGWWQLGDVRPQAELRMHDLSDGFALLGTRNQTRLLPSLSTSAVQLRNDAGDAFVQIAPSKNITVSTPAAVTVVAASVTLDAPTVTCTGSLAVTGAITSAVSVTAPAVVGSSTVTAAGKSLSTHTHSGVQTGTGTSGPPT
jgi:phage baseplate assembly protein gpV